MFNVLTFCCSTVVDESPVGDGDGRWLALSNTVTVYASVMTMEAATSAWWWRLKLCWFHVVMLSWFLISRAFENCRRFLITVFVMMSHGVLYVAHILDCDIFISHGSHVY